MHKRVTFNHKLLPYLLVTPQIVITLVFFIWPAAQALRQSVFREDPFGLRSAFVGFDNFEHVLTDPFYLGSLWTTAVFSVSVTVLSLSLSLLLAVQADRAVRGAGAYKTLLIWPYAVAPAVAGVLWLFLFNPTIGVVTFA